MRNRCIAVIGAGELGSRHLQGLAKCAFGVDIQVVDPSEQSLSIAEKRFQEMPANTNIKSIEFIQDMTSLKLEIDLAIIATNANVRLKVLKNILQGRVVKSLLLEKVLFQSLEELDEAEKILSETGTVAYVNCPKRSYESSKIICEKIKNDLRLSCHVEGTNWGLGCNAIHFLDTMAFYCGRTGYSLDTSGLDTQIQQSKRPGFVEFTGELVATFGPNKVLKLVSKKGSEVLFQMTLESEQYKISLDEKLGRLQVFNKLSSTEELIECKTPFQSQLTHEIAKRIIFNQPVGLPDFKTSASLHRPLLTELLKFYNKCKDVAESYLPVT